MRLPHTAGRSHDHDYFVAGAAEEDANAKTMPSTSELSYNQEANYKP